MDGLRTQLATMVPSLTDADLAIVGEARYPAALTEGLSEVIRDGEFYGIAPAKNEGARTAIVPKPAWVAP